MRLVNKYIIFRTYHAIYVKDLKLMLKCIYTYCFFKQFWLFHIEGPKYEIDFFPKFVL